MNRREFTKTLFAFGGLTLAAPWTSIVRAAATAYDVSYIWHSDLEAALDYMEEVGQVLGSDIRRKLRIVQGDSGNYGVVFDCNCATEPAAQKIAREQSVTLAEEGFEKATVVRDTGYHELYNIVYGKGPNLDAHKENYEAVSRILGPDVKNRLVIEQTQDGEYALVYKRYGDRASSMKIVKAHRDSLQGSGIRVSFIRENNNDVVYGEASFLHEEFVKEPPPTKTVAKIDSDLEQKIESYVRSKRKEGGLASDEATSWSVYDFTSNTKLVTINEDIARQAASMIKPFVALAFFHESERGRYIYGPKTRILMERMIQHSSNSSTNKLIELLGGPKAVDQILRGNYSSIFKQTRIVESIPAGGRTYRNLASAHDYSRFLFSLWKGRLPNSREIRRLMALPNRDRLYDGVPNIPKGTLVYHKTGTTSRLCGDFGILAARGHNGKRYPYTVVAIIEKRSRTRNLTSWINSRGNVIRHISAMVYDELKAKHNLA